MSDDWTETQSTHSVKLWSVYWELLGTVVNSKKKVTTALKRMMPAALSKRFYDSSVLFRCQQGSKVFAYNSAR